MALAVAGMVIVAVSLVAMVLADAAPLGKSHPAMRTTVRSAWLIVVIVGWAIVGYLALGTAGGLDAAWTWVSDQSLFMQIAMWLFLLPWMGALWIWQTSLAEWLRIALIAGLAVLSIGLAIWELRPKR